ncbi:MAG: phosphohistidine phosphatase SixA [Candidatus Omnitrophica bacterium CG1_02_49_16]|nr:MAG: phosphohistidine phosphatase SixA [Candidatus Omnitrophica bacterium CG1_02_49_16]
MELYFLRHALAVEPGTVSLSQDSERPLALAGIEKMKKTAEGLRRMAFSLDRIVSSPYVRALETAQIVAEGLGFKGKVEFSEALTPNAEFKLFFKLLKGFGADEKVLLVGHRPSIGEFVSMLTVGKVSSTIDFKPGGLCRVKMPVGIAPGALGQLKWFLTPKQIRLFK